MDWNKKNIKTTILIAFACILFYLGVKNIGLVMESLGSVLDVTFPFILGACIAFVLNVPMTKIENRLFRGESRKKKKSIFNDRLHFPNHGQKMEGIVDLYSKNKNYLKSTKKIHQV